jgi:hypothetical protein
MKLPESSWQDARYRPPDLQFFRFFGFSFEPARIAYEGVESILCSHRAKMLRAIVQN